MFNLLRCLKSVCVSVCLGVRMSLEKCSWGICLSKVLARIDVCVSVCPDVQVRFFSLKNHFFEIFGRFATNFYVGTR